MDLKILPNEVFVKEFGALIRTRCPKDHVTDQMIHQRVLNANLSAGDIVTVQCFNHDRTAVLHYAEYLVYDRSTQIRRIEVNDSETRQIDDVSFSVMRMAEWKDTPLAEKPTAIHLGNLSNVDIRWNPGKKVHQILVNGEVVQETVDKDEAERIKRDRLAA